MPNMVVSASRVNRPPLLADFCGFSLCDKFWRLTRGQQLTPPSNRDFPCRAIKNLVFGGLGPAENRRLFLGFLALYCKIIQSFGSIFRKTISI